MIDFYSTLCFNTNYDIKYIFEGYEDDANIYKIQKNDLNYLLNQINNTSDFMNIQCFDKKLLFKNENIECHPNVKLVKIIGNYDCTIYMKDMIHCIDLAYDDVFLIMNETLFQIAYRIKSLGIFYLNNWRVVTCKTYVTPWK